MDRHATFRRTIILGNSGSGKSWLSARLAAALGADALDLDSIHWEPGGYDVPRDKQLSIDLVRRSAARPTWVIEGVYGWLAQEALPTATALIWLDLPVDACIENLRQRGMRGLGTEAGFEALLGWAADYPHRQTSSSYAGHERIFGLIPGPGFRLRSRADVERFSADVSRMQDG